MLLNNTCVPFTMRVARSFLPPSWNNQTDETRYVYTGFRPHSWPTVNNSAKLIIAEHEGCLMEMYCFVTLYLSRLYRLRSRYARMTVFSHGE